jgi:small basic protein
MRLSNFIPIVGGFAGFFGVYLSRFSLPDGLSSYLSLAALAGLDSICGGIRSGLEGKFHDDIFLTGFAMNTLLSAALAYLGDRIGVDLFLAAVVMLGGRVFLNLSLIRRFWLTNRQLGKRRETPSA